MLKTSRLITMKEQEQLLKDYPPLSQDARGKDTFIPLRLYMGMNEFYLMEVRDIEGDFEIRGLYNEPLKHETKITSFRLSEIENVKFPFPSLIEAKTEKRIELSSIPTRDKDFKPAALKDIRDLAYFVNNTFNKK